MTTTLRALIFVALATLIPATSQAETPFDGTWRGRSIAEAGRCPQHYDVFVTIKDGRIKGRMVSRYEQLTVGSSVDPGGRLDTVFAYNGRTILKVMNGRLGQDRGRLSWMGHGLEEYKLRGATCHGTITLQRTSTGTQ